MHLLLYLQHLQQMDVKVSFLNENLEENVYINQPIGFDEKGNERVIASFSPLVSQVQ